MILDRLGRKWFKGNLHTHTTRTDGNRTPEEVISLYRTHGYDFLAMTDHWKLSDAVEEEVFLQLSGCEFDMGSCAQEGIYHIVGVGMQQMPTVEKCGLTPQRTVDAIHSAGGLAILAHPAWSLNRAENLLSVNGFDGVEIYNSVSGRPWNARPYSGAFVDDLAVLGKLVPCMAADDAHFYNGDECLSYLMVQAESLTREHILAAIRQGHFFATQGPFFSVAREGNTLVVESSPVCEIVFFSDRVYAADRVTKGEQITRAQYQIKPDEHFIRVELFDLNGRCAWSSPISVR